ncbi:hypothetical protein [Occallatibacter savannae]|uniref:hypothetical protein n=1 Tax=Occallatibacter savannae TaxID=1002691 RepID=UPI000D6A00D9|nr:hypothetical protein [Occallatibacter savannae]
MLPRELKAESFASYPPQARAIATEHLGALQRLPFAFAPSLLREVIDFDYKFPAERSTLQDELSTLDSLSDAELHQWFEAFFSISLSSTLENFDWVNLPAQFVEQQAAYLWSTHQLDGFRKAATEYGDRLNRLRKPELNRLSRVGVAIIGREVQSYSSPLFKNLRKHGTYFTNVSPQGGLACLMAALEERAQNYPQPFAHWYVEGGDLEPHGSHIASVSYRALTPTRNALLKRMQEEISRPGMGPEELRAVMARLTPTDLKVETGTDPVLSRFELKLLTEGSGTQIYSTAFAQWASREVLRRAQPLTLLVRYAPRQRQRPMNELLAGGIGQAELDPVGSLIDGDMGAYYQWIDQQRLSESERSSFIAWFEDHQIAVAIGPAMPRGAESNTAIDMEKLFSMAVT